MIKTMIKPEEKILWTWTRDSCARERAISLERARDDQGKEDGVTGKSLRSDTASQHR